MGKLAKNISKIPATIGSYKKNAVIYCRVSSNKKAQLESLSEQLSGLTRKIANTPDLELVDMYVDIASAKGEVQRTQFNRMLSDCETNHFSVVYVKSVSRFGRDTVETLSAIRKLKQYGIKVIFVEENLDSSNQDLELEISIRMGLAQADNESRSYNIKRGLTMKAQQGTTGLANRKCYGYSNAKDGSLVIDEERAAVVRMIFDWYLDGYSTLKIIRKLEEENIPTATGKKSWSKKAIEKMLINYKYIGCVYLEDSLNKEQAYLIQNHHPAIISKAIFDEVQQELSRRSNVVIDEDGVHRAKKRYSSKL